MKMPKLKKMDPVEIHWYDPIALRGEWAHVRKRDMAIGDTCITVGMVYKVHQDAITVICTWDSNAKNANGGITIPIGVIENIRRLK